MIRKFTVLFLGTVFSVTASAQSASSAVQTSSQASAQAGGHQAQATGNAAGASSANSSSANAGLSSGTTFNSSLTKQLDAKKAKPRDSVEARTTENLKANGKTVLPKGTRLVGHVTQASARAKGDSQSALAIVFDRAVLKDGSEVPLQVEIQALASSETMVAGSEADVDSVNMAGTGASGSARGVLGSIGSTAGGAVGGAGATKGSVFNTAGRDVSGTSGAAAGVAGGVRGIAGGLNAAGQLTSNSHGVFGLNGLNLNSSTESATQGSIITSPDKNIHLASGTRMLLVTQATATGSKP